MILNKAERQQVRARLERSGKDIVELSPHQIENFAGDAVIYITNTAKNCSCCLTAPFRL